MSAGSYAHLAPAFLQRASSPGLLNAWHYIFHHIQSYEASEPIRPLKFSDSEPGTRRIITHSWRSDNGAAAAQPFPCTAQSYDGAELRSTRLDTAADAGNYLQSATLSHGNRGAYHAFDGGARYWFHVLLRHIARGSCDRGYVWLPICHGTTIHAIIIRKGHHSWTLTDTASMSGPGATAQIARSPIGDSRHPTGFSAAISHYRILRHLQQFARARLGADLGMTIGGTAIHAAQRYLPTSEWLWRPSAFAVTLCRLAGGYRGGYVYGTSYHGPAYQIDINKAYTSAMRGPLPTRSAPYVHIKGAPEIAGLYLCEVSGVGRLPIALSRYISDATGFQRGNWSGGYCVAMLASDELASVRRLGYTIAISGGIRWLRSFDFGRLADTIGAISTEFGRGSVEERFAKCVGNALYGKLGANPDTTSVCYARDRPSGDYRPFCAENGDEVDGLWVRRENVYRAYQHVDIAAVITARVRGMLYDQCANVLDAGGQVLAASTDALIVDTLPAGALGSDDTAIGAWRLVAYDEHATVAGRNAYSLGGKLALSGVSQPTGKQIEMVSQGEKIIVGGTRLQAPWLSEAMYLQAQSEISRSPAAGTTLPA